MLLRFKHRIGHTPLPKALSPSDMPDDLRNSLWNVFDQWRNAYTSAGQDKRILEILWGHYYKQPIDSIPVRHGQWSPSYASAWKVVRERFFQGDWADVYDFLDFCLKVDRNLGTAVDQVLKTELAAYRVIDRQIVPVTDEAEVDALKQALSGGGRFAGTATHLRTALAHLTDRKNPDYRNSIKESISAVEAMAVEVSGKKGAGLDDALAVLERSGKLHKALRKGYAALYGYTSDANGIRHALMDEPNLTQEDAKYFLLICTAFVNYLKTMA
ncbi:AbiJ-NTD4 domain-containing protein [Burkholderia multivorans]|uniref:AbiJ-NTD4 domain-containing protein n=1 Tax=Burkholderia multivorans TaxID=87883 RepID=UPI0020B3D848|nr:hypothetical protein [Burkholderia multivorans]